MARQAYEQARAWAEDSLIIQLCEAWIGLRTVRSKAWASARVLSATQGGDAYQSAYYVFEEISQSSSGNNVVVVNGKAAAQAAQGNWPEAEAALAEATELVRRKPALPSRADAMQNADYAETLANGAALANISGKGPQSKELLSCVYNDYTEHCMTRQCRKLQLTQPAHPLLADLEAKSALFDEAASKYVVSVA